MKPLRIAVDARPLSLPMVGITRYSYELISRLVHSPHQWFLYLDKAPIHPLPQLPNVHIRCGNAGGRALSTLFAQLVFPLWARADKVDVFWSPRHHLPLLLPRRVATLLTIHDMVWRVCPKTMSRLGYAVERLLMPASLGRADAVLAVSDATRSDIVSFDRRYMDKLSVVLSGLTHRPASGQAAVDMEKPYFLFVGTLEPRKNLPRLLRAFALFAQSNTELCLVLVGGAGWGGEDLVRQISTLGLQDRVVLTGRISDQQLADYYASAAALLMPSLYEGFGLPLLEAMGHGVPVMTSDRGAMQEVAGEGGLLVDPMSEQAMCSAMQSLLDPARHRQLSAQALARAGDFNWDRAAKAVLEWCQAVAGAPE